MTGAGGVSGPDADDDGWLEWIPDVDRNLVLLVVVAALYVLGAGAGLSATGEWVADAGTHLETDTGVTVQLGSQTRLDTTTHLNSSAVDVGGGVIRGQGNSYLFVDEMLGTHTIITNINAGGDPVWINPDDKQPVRVGNDIDQIKFREVNVSDGADGELDLRYEGSTGTSDITIYGLPADTFVQAYDLDTGEELALNKTTNNGTLVYKNLPNSAHRVDLRGGIYPPYVSSFSPANNSWEPSGPVTLNVTVQNPANESVEVEFYSYDPDNPFAQFAEDNFVAQNAPITVQPGDNVSFDVDPVPGRNYWYVALKDSNNDVTSRVFWYRHPGGVQAYNSSSRDPISGVTASIDSLESSYSAVKTNSTGSVIDLEGAPDENLAVELNASGFYNRTIEVSDPAKRIYTLLYPKPSNPASDTEPVNFTQTFNISDETGKFPPADTDLLAQRYFDGAWRTVDSAYCGATNKCILELQDGITYRMVAESDNGTAIPGTYFADEDRSNEVVTIYITAENRQCATVKDSDCDGVLDDEDQSTASNPPQADPYYPTDGEYVRNRTTVGLTAYVTEPDNQSFKSSMYIARNGSFVLVSNRTFDAGEEGQHTAVVDAEPGDNVWTVVLADLGGATNQEQWTFRTPNYINAYNDSSGAEVTASIEVEIESTTSAFAQVWDFPSGSPIDLNTVPDEPLVVQINGTGYWTRTLMIRDPSERINTTLIPKSEPAPIEQCFTLNDETGDYPPSETTLIAEKAFDGSYVTVAGDNFGAGNKACLDLVVNDTYSLIVRNAGNIRDIGRWTQPPAPTELQPLTISEQSSNGTRGDDGSYEFETDGNTTWSWDAWMSPSPNPQYPNGSRISVRFYNPTEEVTDVRVEIWERGNESAVVFDKSYSNVTDLAVNVDIAESELVDQYVVRISGTQGTESFSAQRVVGTGPEDLFSGASVPGWLLQYASAGVLLLTAGSFGRRNVRIAAVIIPVMAGIMWALGTLTGVANAASVLFALMLGGATYLYSRGGI